MRNGRGREVRMSWAWKERKGKRKWEGRKGEESEIKRGRVEKRASKEERKK